MAQPAPERSTRELRQLFGRLTDQAAGLIASSQTCECGAGAHAAGGPDLNEMINELIPIRQRVGGCICGPPCDGTNVEDDLGDAALDAMLGRLEWQYSVLHEEVNAAPCDCAERPEIPERRTEPVEPAEPVVPVVPEILVPQIPRTLMGFPEELRSMIWWETLRPRNGIVRIVPYTMIAPSAEDARIGGPEYHRQRFSVPGDTRNVLEPQRETWARLGERFDPRTNEYNILRADRQIYEEAEREFWRRVATDRLMLSFGPEVHSRDLPAPTGPAEYNGILSAWTFFMTLLRDDPNNPNTQHFPENLRQALAPFQQMGRTNAIQYLDGLLELMHRHLTGLEHLSLAFGGWVPDLSQTPWREGPPMAMFGGVPQPAIPSSRHWVLRLMRFRTRPLTRLRLRVVFYLPGIDTMSLRNLAQTPAAIRAAHFITSLRREMLVNGNALGDGLWKISRDNSNPRGVNGPIFRPRIIVWCDDSWDEDTETHVQHKDGRFEYDPP
ncbi:hypothetical protein F5883DRAFT_719405 [Diaporthe sp. PMI_573]|nr:hypothetical protein F5883DRAFT_719405 [Diaporthaceae sp. PMI_573]